jgi:hypothetical protein
MALALSTALTVFVLIVGVVLTARLGVGGASLWGTQTMDQATAVAPALQNATEAAPAPVEAVAPAAQARSDRPGEREREHAVAAYGREESRSAEHRGRSGREDDYD